MKNCRKCKIEYKENYTYCPKCGTPNDPKIKRVKVPDDVVGGTMYNVKKFLNIFLYIFGVLLIFAYIVTIKENPFESIFAILFALSLFQKFYKIIGDKFNTIDEKHLKKARIILPIIILIFWMICFPSEKIENESSLNEDTSIKTEEKEETNDLESDEQDEVIEEDIEVEEPKEEPKEDPKEISYELNYKLLGDYGKLVEYEGEKEYFYYFPAGTYEIESTRVGSVYCFLWLDYNEGYKTQFGTSYNNKQKLQFSKKGEKQTIVITNDVHLYNSNDCSYKLTKKD